jgi:pimeloyl-ACP methyl ester carboxylesterase
MQEPDMSVALVLSTALLAIGAPAGAGPSDARLAPCTVPGSTVAVRCGSVTVPEDRSKPEGRRIDLRVVVIPAVKPDPAMAPLYDLAGGPGLAATDGADFYLTAGQAHRQGRDIVLVDQRGTGASAPLACPELAGTGSTYPDAAVRACRERLATQADLSRYTTADAVADLQAVRAALGHRQVDLFGISYGTRLALAWIAAEPDAIRSAALVGTVPENTRPPLWHARNAQDTLEAVFADCRADAACAAAHPTLAHAWDTLLVRPDFDGAARERLRTSMVATPGLRSLPSRITQMAATGPPPAAPPAGPPIAEGLYLSVTCAEDVPWITPGERVAATRGTFLGTYRIDRQASACSIWDVPRSKVVYPQGTPDVPVLFIAGERDYVTPVAWANAVASRFPRSRVVSIPHLGHFPDGLSGVECLDTMLLAFAAQADPQAVPTGCVGSMRPGAFAGGTQ